MRERAGVRLRLPRLVVFVLITPVYPVLWLLLYGRGKMLSDYVFELKALWEGE